MNGYQGVVALIDLASRSVERIELDESIVRKYIGGSGLGTYYLMKYSRVDTKPLSPDNPLIYMTGPYMGSGVPTSGRHHIIFRSPLTGIFGESDAGGTFGYRLKRAGFDGLIIVGRAEEPVYISVIDGEISFSDARHLWGLDTYTTEARIVEEIGKKVTVSCIGPAGENLVPLAGIFHDGMVARTAGRGGLGAVMGSKNLKAIAVGGSRPVNIYRQEELLSSIREKTKQLKEAGMGLHLYGTAGGMETAEKFGDIPIKNWKLGSWTPQVKNVSGQKMAETILEKNYSCFACPIGCGRIVKFNGYHGGGPEYETVAMLGSACLIDDLEVIAKANELCNRYGLDTISVGGAIAFALELFEEGIITEKETGRKLVWGEEETLIALIKEIAHKKGFGAILGLGVKKAAEMIGRGAEKYAIHAKGMELPAHDPRCFKGLAVGYATSNRGACHLSSFTYPWERSASMPELGYATTHDRTLDREKGELAAKFQNLMSMADSLKICKFALIVGVKIEELINWLNLITGWDVNFDEFMQTGERIFTLKRWYNNALGITRKDDTLPERILKEPRGEGGSADTVPNLELQLEEYYRYRGWNQEGVPTLEKLRKLGLENFIDWKTWEAV